MNENLIKFMTMPYDNYVQYGLYDNYVTVNMDKNLSIYILLIFY